jgi:light-regulated signal transduction histidine kinase (bacteriophytochrome)
MAEGAAIPPDLRQLVHDLRSPVAIVDGFSALLERDQGDLTAEQRADFIRRIRAAAAEMRSLLDGAVG